MATNEGRRPVPRAIIEVRNLRKEYPVEDETVVALDGPDPRKVDTVG